jgi:hypothetical protein
MLTRKLMTSSRAASPPWRRRRVRKINIFYQKTKIFPQGGLAGVAPKASDKLFYQKKNLPPGRPRRRYAEGWSEGGR